jgi:hypothetical protein
MRIERSRSAGIRTERLVASESFANFDISQLHVNYALTNMSIAYTNAQFLAEWVAPVVPSDKASNDYYVYGLERFLHRDTHRAPGATPGETGWSVAPYPFKCDGRSVRGWYPWEAPSAADPAIDLDVDTTEVATEQVLLDQEINLVEQLKADVTPVDLSGSSGAYQFDNSSSDPVLYIEQEKSTIQKAVGRRPNAILFGRPAWTGFRNNPNVLKHIFGTSVVGTGQQITTDMAKALLEVDEVQIADSMYNTAVEGATPALDFIWGDCTLLFYRDPGAGRRKLNLATTFLWDIALPAQQGEQAEKLNGWIVEKWYDRNKKRMNIDVNKYFDQVMTAAGAGILFTKTVGAASGAELGAAGTPTP